MNLEDNYPRKVLAGFVAAGVHADCVYASLENVEGPCAECRAAMKLVIQKHYTGSYDDALHSFRQDIRNDQLGEVDD